MAFWGLKLEPGKRYSTTVENTFHISKAVLDVSTADNDFVSVMLQEGNSCFILCHLHSKSEPQTDLDLNFITGDKISLYCTGNGTVHLSGYMVIDDEDDLLKHGDEDEEEVAEQSENMFNEEDEDSEDKSDEETDEDEEEEEESDEEILPPSKKQKKDVKRQQNGEVSTVGIKKEIKAGAKKGPKEESQKASPAPTDSTRVLSGGVTVKDIKAGNGPVAQPGKKAVVYYVGRLKSNNKVFDSCKKGSGFKFNIGKGEVIKGWDLGVAGMKVGGKRVITCPPQMAYGAKGAPPDIPPNSTLTFIVELKAVN